MSPGKQCRKKMLLYKVYPNWYPIIYVDELYEKFITGPVFKLSEWWDSLSTN
jgi:hypothetical protein